MKKNDKQLSWVAGNDVNLCVWLYELVRNGNETVRQPFDFSVCERIDAMLSSFYVGKIAVPYAISAQDANCLVLSIPHTVPAGLYGIEIKAEQDGVHLRSFEGGAIAVVNKNEEAKTTFEVISYQRRTEYEIELQFVPSAQVRPLNMYEIWKQQPGNEGKTFDDFMNDYAQQEIEVAVGDTLNQKVDKVPGKGLSENDFTTLYKSAIDALMDDLVAGKRLSTNDFTQYYKGSIISLQSATSELGRTKLGYQFVDELPPVSSTNITGKLFLVRLQSGYFDGYVYDQNAPTPKFVKIIEHIDLSSYSTTAQMNEAIQAALATVPGWAMTPTKPTYTAGEVGAYTKEEVDEALQNVDIDVDSALSENSENPVQNRVVKEALDAKADRNNTYTREEVNNLVVPVGRPVIIVDPAEWPLESGEANNIYRVPGENSYTDYGWNGTQFVQLAEYTTAYSGDVWY